MVQMPSKLLMHTTDMTQTQTQLQEGCSDEMSWDEDANMPKTTMFSSTLRNGTLHMQSQIQSGN